MEIAYGVKLNDFPSSAPPSSAEPHENSTPKLQLPIWYTDLCHMFVVSIAACLWFDVIMWGTEFSPSFIVDLLGFVAIPSIPVAWVYHKILLKKFKFNYYQLFTPPLFGCFIVLFGLYIYTA